VKIKNTLLLLVGLCLGVVPCAQNWLLPPESPASPRSIRLSMSDDDYQRLVDARAAKIEINNVTMELDGLELPIKRVRLRGNSALNFRRKSYSVALREKQRIAFGEEERMVKKFMLNSMTMDRGYFRNRFAFLCLREMGLFPLRHGYLEIIVNGRSEGLGLILQRPEDYALNEGKGRFILRRGYGERVESFEAAKDVGKKEEKAYLKAFEEIVDMCRHLKGEALYRRLSARVDLDAYFRWLAFNYWIRNGDYTDEIYFYTATPPKSVRFSIIPWDYDDIFAPKPHEGQIKRDQHLGDKHLFSSESLMDRTIAKDPVLYERYLVVLEEVLNFFNSEQLRAILTQVYQELYPYFQKEAIIEASIHDKYGGVNLNMLKQELVHVYEYFLEKRREEILRALR
jgi:spore coat protein H